MAKKSDRKRRYMCVGENFRDNAEIGDCGDVRTLQGWLEHLFPKAQDINAFFDDSYSNKDVVDYIYKNVGKRLKEV
jgi:hypothetical protein